MVSVPERSAERSVARMSIRPPRGSGANRRVGTCMIGSRMREMMALASATSSADMDSKSMDCRISRCEYVRPHLRRFRRTPRRRLPRRVLEKARPAIGGSACRVRLHRRPEWSAASATSCARGSSGCARTRGTPGRRFHADPAVDEHRMERPVKIVSAGNACGFDGACGVDDLAGPDGQPRRAQDTSEVHDVLGEPTLFFRLVSHVIGAAVGHRGRTIPQRLPPPTRRSPYSEAARPRCPESWRYRPGI